MDAWTHLPGKREGVREREREKQTDLRMPSCPFFSLEVNKMTLLKERAFTCCLLYAQFFHLQQNSIYCYSQFIEEEIEAHRGSEPASRRKVIMTTFHPQILTTTA